MREAMRSAGAGFYRQSAQQGKPGGKAVAGSAAGAQGAAAMGPAQQPQQVQEQQPQQVQEQQPRQVQEQQPQQVCGYAMHVLGCMSRV